LNGLLPITTSTASPPGAQVPGLAAATEETQYTIGGCRPTVDRLSTLSATLVSTGLRDRRIPNGRWPMQYAKRVNKASSEASLRP
jgi:hypothetical protein